jgi:membrane protease subunit (stomatin/prohibitin family)
MGQLWQKVRGEFAEIIEWIDDRGEGRTEGRIHGAARGSPRGSDDTLAWRFDRHDHAIRMGSQLIVREGQWAVFLNEGRIADSFGPGRHRLATRNLPLLTSLLALPYGFESPFKAEVVFVTTRRITNLRWGTSHPVILQDPELGPVRVRGFGSHTLRVNDPASLVRELCGSRGRLGVEDIRGQLRGMIISRLAEVLGRSGHPVTRLAAHYDTLAWELRVGIGADLQDLGLEIPSLVIETLTLPAEVEAALDRRSSLALGAPPPPPPPPLPPTWQGAP